MVEFFGHKTVAIFDLWSIAHFLTGCSLAYPLKVIKKYINISRRESILIVLLISSTWEIVELYLELGVIGGYQVEYWFQGVEHPLNRIISDQLLLLFGYLLVRDRVGFALPAKLLALSWLVINVVFVPHSMYLQELWNLSSTP